MKKVKGIILITTVIVSLFFSLSASGSPADVPGGYLFLFIAEIVLLWRYILFLLLLFLFGFLGFYLIFLKIKNLAPRILIILPLFFLITLGIVSLFILAQEAMIEDMRSRKPDLLPLGPEDDPFPWE